MHTEMLLRGVNLADEFRCELGDPRRTRRIQRLAEGLSRKPELSLPDLFEDPAELEGAYRALRNPEITLLKLISAHVEATAQRCADLDAVLVIHDTTEFSFSVRDEHMREHLGRLAKGRQGFYGHVSLVTSADGLRAPLGVAQCFGYVHRKQVDEESHAFWDGVFGSYDRESERWANGIIASEERLGDTTAIHVCDREADTNAVLQTLNDRGSRYVIRAYQARKSADGTPVEEVARDSTLAVRRTIELSTRPVSAAPPKSRKAFAPRKARRAKVVIRAQRARFPIGRDQSADINVVEVLEQRPPDGETPMHWTLLTSEPVETEQQLLRVVDLYRSRWQIEEFFKAIKTGCSYEKRQLNSAGTLLAALGLTLVLAWQLLVIRHLSRLEQHHDGPKLPASAVLSPDLLALLIALTPKLKWPRKATVGDVSRGLARLGGHHRSNGPPGWQVLGRGHQKLINYYEGARAAAAAGLVINP